MLKFSDGEVFDTSGPYRKEERYDGWYILGNHRLIPMPSEEECDNFLIKNKNDS